MEFPTRYLWEPDWKEELRGELEAKKKKKEYEEKERKRQEKLRQEQQEKALYDELKQKFEGGS